jgi:hypothetical protein
MIISDSGTVGDRVGTRSSEKAWRRSSGDEDLDERSSDTIDGGTRLARCFQKPSVN